ncbi:hypothetical conserved protein [Candidatus Nitrosoglobus terrae]|uniref:Hypothetical conserved protein n=1 Tax=Candidatus Nitrosoglobus terrae TaxID=1630141 RepID=A0A1Q2SN39_9GAMM|nr:hypothetical protein [Candidatus Nitrosoglobus terrae]BAW80558.1 hypothetical conserved protein [Candidatus Nitrosoglobus terrae]
MRYKEDVITGGVGAPVADEGILAATALFALIAGIIVCIVGKRVHILWAIVTGGSLAVVSGVYLVAIMLGYSSF